MRRGGDIRDRGAPSGETPQAEGQQEEEKDFGSAEKDDESPRGRRTSGSNSDPCWDNSNSEPEEEKDDEEGAEDGDAEGNPFKSVEYASWADYVLAPDDEGFWHCPACGKAWDQAFKLQAHVWAKAGQNGHPSLKQQRVWWPKTPKKGKTPK